MRLRRRGFLLLPLSFALSLRAGNSEGKTVLRGKLGKDQQGRAALLTPDGRSIPLHGDEETTLVLADGRLAGADFEVIGSQGADGSFEINPIHLAALYAYKNGSRKRVTYWCDVCAIRTYSPGLCWCCREETALDLRDPDKVG